MGIRHAKVSAKADGGDTSEVRPSDWNADHEDTSNIFDVKSYGALGDGAADDTAEIQAAIDDVPSYTSGMGGAIVSFPPGKYIISSTLTIPSTKSGITLRGAGEASTWLIGSVAGGPILSTFYDNTANVSNSFVTIEGMVIYNSSVAASSCGLRIVQAGTVNVKRCQITTLAAYPALVADAGYLYYFDSCTFHSDGAYAVRVGQNGLGLVNVLSFTNCSYVNSVGGAHIIGSTAVAFNVCHFEGLSGGSSASAIFLDSVIGININSCYFEDAGDYCIRTSEAAFGIMAGLTVQSNLMYNPKVGMMDLTGCQSSVIMPNNLHPGPNNANPTGISGLANALSMTVMPQYLQTWGSGAAINATNYNQSTYGFGPFNGNGAPANGGQLNGIAEKGALYIDYTNGKLYINTGTKASVAWTVVGTQT